jgi:hypothetical protein
MVKLQRDWLVLNYVLTDNVSCILIRNCPVGREQKIQHELELIGTHQPLVYADINLLAEMYKRYEGEHTDFIRL